MLKFSLIFKQSFDFSKFGKNFLKFTQYSFESFYKQFHNLLKIFPNNLLKFFDFLHLGGVTPPPPTPKFVHNFRFKIVARFYTIFAFSGNEKNWKTDDNGFSTRSGVKNLDDNSLTGIEYQIAGKGGTRWATAKEEAIDERRDPEILQAVFNSIAEWEERRRIRQAK